MSHKEIRVIDEAFPHTCLSTMPVRHGGDRSPVIVPKWWGSKRISRWSFLTKNIAAAASSRGCLQLGSSGRIKSNLVVVNRYSDLVIPDSYWVYRKLQHFSILYRRFLRESGKKLSSLNPEFRPFLMALTDLDFRHKFVIDNPETPPYGPMFTNFGLL